MTIQYDDKGKYYTDVIRKAPIKAYMQTSLHLIYGEIHIRESERIKDELDRDELFLAITDATIYSLDKKPLYKTKFLAVCKEQIIWVLPDDDYIEGFSEMSG
ncbi:MAG: hypothetical protein JXA13_05230 [Anaerolineales bacterium]|nr:hypothetical protein [Anaerolineales bacterium]